MIMIILDEGIKLLCTKEQDVPSVVAKSHDQTVIGSISSHLRHQLNCPSISDVVRWRGIGTKTPRNLF